MKTILTTILFLVFTCFVNAGGDNQATGSRSAAMGGASVTLSDLWSTQHNQAGLAGLNSVRAGIYYQNRFLLSELGLKAVAIAVPVPKAGNGVFGLSFSSFGYSMYSDSKIGLAYAKQLGEKYSVGVQIDYLHTQIGLGHGSKGSVAIEAGLRAELIENLNIGVHVFNPTRSKIAEYEVQGSTTTERIPTVMRLGLSYTFSEKVLLALEVEKDVYTKPVFKAGIEYLAIKQLYIRGGLSSDPLYNTFGFGLNLKQFKIDFAASKHQILGYTPQLSITYNFKRDTTKQKEE